MSAPPPSPAAPTLCAPDTALGRPHRGAILLEDASVVAHTQFAGDQHILRLHSPRCAARATAGSFVHLRCIDDLPMRRPLSIMRADATAGWIELLFKVTGAGTRALAQAQPPATAPQDGGWRKMGPAAQDNGAPPDNSAPIEMSMRGPKRSTRYAWNGENHVCRMISSETVHCSWASVVPSF